MSPGVAGAVGRNYDTNFTPPGTESQRALDLLKREFPAQSGDVDSVVFHVTSGTVDSPQVRDAITKLLGQVNHDPHVIGVISPYGPRGAVEISPGRKTAIATINYDKPAVGVLQIAATDEASAADALLAATGGQQDLRLANVPVDEVPSRALRSLGAHAVVAQHEMLLRL